MSKTLKKTVLTAAVSTALIAGGLVTTKAHAELSFNIGVTSNYMFRGLEESGGDAAIQGGIDFEHESGFYIGTWTSSLGGSYLVEIDGEDEGVFVSPGYELDLYFGYAGEITDTGIGFDVGYIYYAYPQMSDADFGEIYAGLDYMGFYGSVARVVNAKDSDFKGTMAYELGYAFEVMPSLELGATLGYVDPDDSDDKSYTWYSLHATKSMDFGDITFAVIGNSERELLDKAQAVVSYEISF